MVESSLSSPEIHANRVHLKHAPNIRHVIYSFRASIHKQLSSLSCTTEIQKECLLVTCFSRQSTRSSFFIFQLLYGQWTGIFLAYQYSKWNELCFQYKLSGWSFFLFISLLRSGTKSIESNIKNVWKENARKWRDDDDGGNANKANREH